ncbi:MAG TPA: hypothetical protein VE685_02590 [Thermoanaerobaculia bacterium]|nr:hypothetical protein [Thermoanaerobaculia bacterium]
MRNKGIFAAFVVMVLCGLSPLVAAPMIERGIDVFTTTANGKTFYDFAANPIPAGFFCKGSTAFTGRVALKGLPLETEIPGQLLGSDTVVERLDDAAFDENGVARTRVRFRALSLVSIVPIKTSCGAFHLYITLDGPQRATPMRIYRTHEQGGTFLAPLTAAVRMTFVPVKGRSSRRLVLTGSVNFPGHDIPWSLESNPAVNMKRIPPVVVDTNGDLVPDSLLSGTSNFAPGWSPRGDVVPKAGCRLCQPETCHSYSGEQHCTGPVYACDGMPCPDIQ